MITLRSDDPRPLYVQLSDALRREIAHGRLPRGSAIDDERKLASSLGLSRVTVRRAIGELAEEGLVERIRGRGTYVASARHPRRASAPVLRELILVARFDRREVRSALYYQGVLQGIEEAVPAGASISIRSCARHPTAFADGIRDDGGTALVVLGIVDRRVLDDCAALGVPTVLVDSAQPTTVRLDEVLQEDEESARAAVESLIELGHREIALITYPETPAAAARRRGWRRALAAHGLVADARLEHVVSCTSAAAYARARAILSAPRPPTAAFCATDELAIGVIAAVKDHGWQVPRDLSVFGFGDLGYFTMPPLSSVRVATDRLGAAAVDLLVQRIADRAAAPRSVILPTEPMPRGTCDVPRTAAV